MTSYVGKSGLMHDFMGAIYHVYTHYTTTYYMCIAQFLAPFDWVAVEIQTVMACQVYRHVGVPGSWVLAGLT